MSCLSFTRNRILTNNLTAELEGMARVREVLETNEWTPSGHDDDDDDEDDQEGIARFLEAGQDGLGPEADEFEREMFGLSMAVEKGIDIGNDFDSDDTDENDGDLRVEELEGLMIRMQAIRGWFFLFFFISLSLSLSLFWFTFQSVSFISNSAF